MAVPTIYAEGHWTGASGGAAWHATATVAWDATVKGLAFVTSVYDGKGGMPRLESSTGQDLTAYVVRSQNNRVRVGWIPIADVVGSSPLGLYVYISSGYCYAVALSLFAVAHDKPLFVQSDAGANVYGTLTLTEAVAGESIAFGGAAEGSYNYSMGAGQVLEARHANGTRGCVTYSDSASPLSVYYNASARQTGHAALLLGPNATTRKRSQTLLIG